MNQVTAQPQVDRTEYPHLNIVVIKGTDILGRPTLLVEKLKSKSRFPKPIANFYYKKEDIEFRDKRAAEIVQNHQNVLDRRTKDKEDKANLRKHFVNPFNVGDIFTDSWGYDQTNVDFFQVIEKKDRSVVLRPIGGKMVDSEGSMSGRTVPVKDSFRGEPIAKPVMVRMCAGKPDYYISSSHRGTLSKWDGKSSLYVSWYS
jgi:hypothetical protein